MIVETRFRKMGGRIVDMNSERPRVATNDTFMFKKGGKSGIYIKPENRGKFTASAKRAGRGVQEHARKVLADPNASPTQKKRANFARNAAKWKKEDGGDLGVFRPTDYGYLRGTENISPLGTISREEYESFINDTTNIPELRNTVTDASWRNVLNEFKNDPNLGGLEFADVPRPFGTGESITGRYFRDPEELQRLPIESDMKGVMRKVAPINRGNTPKVNAYNYRRGRPMNQLEMMFRKSGGKMAKYKCGSAMGKACGGKMRTKFSKGAKFQLGDRTMSDK